MDTIEFEEFLDHVATTLRSEAIQARFTSANQFESRVRQVASDHLKDLTIKVDFEPHKHAFPDVALGDFGIEVKFTIQDTWRSIANSVLETNRIESVKNVYVMFGKMGGDPEIKWGRYDECVMHVRTSHVPRFELEMDTATPLFSQMGIAYDDFRSLDMHEKMNFIRGYARGRLREGERMWWLEDKPGEEHTLPIQARLYTKLSTVEKTRCRAEAVLLCPQIVDSGRSKNKYDDVALYLLTYHGILCHQARDLFSAGSIANPQNDNAGGLYIERALKLIESNIREAALDMDDALFEEYWGRSVPPEDRIAEWLNRADEYARDWVPSKCLFLND